MMSTTQTILLFVSILLFGFSLFMAGLRIGESRVQKQAISAGVAEWHCEPTTGKVSFEFNQ